MKHSLLCIVVFATSSAAMAQENNANVVCRPTNICAPAVSGDITIEPGKFVLWSMSKRLSVTDPRVSVSVDSGFHTCFDGERQLTSSDANLENIRLTGEFLCLKVPTEFYNDAMDAVQVWEHL